MLNELAPMTIPVILIVIILILLAISGAVIAALAPVGLLAGGIARVAKHRHDARRGRPNTS